MDLRSWIREEHQFLRQLYELTVRGAIPRDMVTVRPTPTDNSIAWVLWHIARSEDLAVNTIIRGIPQVLARDGWAEKIGINDFRVGTGLSDHEVEDFGKQVDVDALEAYWEEVGACTDRWLQRVSLDALDQVPDLDARLAVAPEIVPPEASWLREFWRDRSVGFFLRFTAIGHAYVHGGEMLTIRSHLGVPGF